MASVLSMIKFYGKDFARALVILDLMLPQIFTCEVIYQRSY